MSRDGAGASSPDAVSGGLRITAFDRVFKPEVITLPNGSVVTRKRSRVPLAIVALVALGALSVRITGFNFATLARRGGEFFTILGQMFPPDWSYMPDVWQPLFDTIKMSLMGSVVGSVLVVPFAMAASTNIVPSRALVVVMRFLLSVIRTLPTIVTALIAIFTFAYVGKVLYEEIETVDMGAFEAMQALGATRVRAFAAAIVPQVLPGYLSNCLFCFEGNVRYASILGYVGAGGLGLVLNEKIGWRMFPQVGMVLVTLFVTVFVIETVSRAARRHLA